MHHVPLDFDAKEIGDVLACLTPEAARVMWCSQDFKVRSLTLHAESLVSDNNPVGLVSDTAMLSDCLAAHVTLYAARAMRCP